MWGQGRTSGARQTLGQGELWGDALSMSLDAMTPEEVVASPYPMVDVIKVPCTVDSAEKLEYA